MTARSLTPVTILAYLHEGDQVSDFCIGKVFQLPFIPPDGMIIALSRRGARREVAGIVDIQNSCLEACTGHVILHVGVPSLEDIVYLLDDGWTLRSTKNDSLSEEEAERFREARSRLQQNLPGE